jgi:hypothetical protein
MHAGYTGIASRSASPKNARGRGEKARRIARGQFCEPVGRVKRHGFSFFTDRIGVALKTTYFSTTKKNEEETKSRPPFHPLPRVCRPSPHASSDHASAPAPLRIRSPFLSYDCITSPPSSDSSPPSPRALFSFPISRPAATFFAQAPPPPPTRHANTPTPPSLSVF